MMVGDKYKVVENPDKYRMVCPVLLGIWTNTAVRLLRFAQSIFRMTGYMSNLKRIVGGFGGLLIFLSH